MKTLSLIKKHLPILLFATTIVTFVSCGGDDDPFAGEYVVTKFGHLERPPKALGVVGDFRILRESGQTSQRRFEGRVRAA